MKGLSSKVTGRCDMKHHGKQTDTVSDERIIELYWQRDENAIKETDTNFDESKVVES